MEKLFVSVLGKVVVTALHHHEFDSVKMERRSIPTNQQQRFRLLRVDGRGFDFFFSTVGDI